MSTKRVKRRRRQMTPIFRLILMVAFGVGIYFSFSTISEIYTTLELKRGLSEAKSKLQEIQDENTYLTSQKEKLTDPNYVQSYARGNYLLTKAGEEIYYLPADE